MLERLTALCLAGAGSPTTPDALWASWSFAPATAGPLLAGLAGLLWLARRGQASWLAFAGWAALALALASPLCRMAATTASAHMAQHVILVAVAPPLLVLGLPSPPRLSRSPLRPALVSAAYTLTIWAAHAPTVYQAALLDDGVHLALLAALLGASLLFWSALFDPANRASAAPTAALALVQTGMLGALLTFAQSPWYPVFGPGPAIWGLTPLEDQQLAGLIMWAPMAVIYLAAGLWALAALLRQTAGHDAGGRSAGAIR